MTLPLIEAAAVVAFWRDAGPKRWFSKNAAFDAEFRDRFLAAHEAAARGELQAWEADPAGALALAILLDQFPRNAFRDTPRMFATDAQARAVATRAIDAGLDAAIEAPLRLFLYLPFEHSESLADQQRSLVLLRALGPELMKHAQQHHDIVARFGRFPHRNAVLGRATTADEQQFLDGGGFRG
jgi:uncharacterized protein (DUF924 family)